MQQLIECVPNFSEGRRPEVVAQIVAAMSAVPGITLLGHSLDADHNRSVVTLIGDAAALAEAAFRGCAQAANLIDLDTQRGAHPRIGATDVIPFIPLRGATTTDCVELARKLGARIGHELHIPVYLYEDAASHEANRNLAAVRHGEYEGLRLAIKNDPARAPDFGPRRLGKAGAVAIGVRLPLIAFNVNLNTTDLSVAKAIAKTVRASSGGLPFVKALGIALVGRGLVQVSMNLTNYTQTSLPRAFDAVQHEAARHGVAILESEIIGLVPAEALLDPAAHHLHLANFTASQVLELRLAEALQTESPLPLQAPDFLAALASPTPAPAGGSAAAYAGAMAASLVMMVAGLTLAKKSYAVVHAEMQAIHAEATRLQAALSAAVAEDARAYSAVMEAYKLPKESLDRAPAIQHAMRGAAVAPIQVAEQSARVLRLAHATRTNGLESARSDITVAIYLAEASIRGALLNAKENLSTMTDETLVREFLERVVAVEDMLVQAK